MGLVRSVADLQELPETQPISMYDEFGLSRCTRTCRESCGFTCGGASCTSTVGVVQELQPAQRTEEAGVSDELVRKAQAASGGKWE